jgi:L-ascorbate metabolism protein UlaG (beta-lactamase superfamily)
MKVTIIGHSTVLIEAAGTKILTDPYFGTWGNLAYKRIAPPSETREGLEAVDLVLVSHNHWDHADSGYFRGLAAEVPIVAPGAAAWITRAKGAKNVAGLARWEKRQFGPVAITAVPALHMGLPGGFVIEADGKQIYFAGDTYFAGFMEEIAAKFRLDLALMPVTTFRIPMTMGEKGAVRAVEVLRPRTVIPIHLGIQPRSPLLRTGQTPEGFSKRVRDAGFETEVAILRGGESWTSRD